MRLRKWTGLIMLALAGGNAQAQPESARIGTESLVSVPTSAMWSKTVNFRPGDGEVVAINPPMFSWSYTPSAIDGEVDIKPKLFVLLVSTSSACSDNFVVARTNAWNFYGMLAPLTNGNLYYWKVGYINPASPYSTNWTTLPNSWEAAPYMWSSIRMFTISNNSVTWDRSMLGQDSYLATKRHPYLLFNETNRADVANWVRTNWIYDWPGISNTAVQALTNYWWPNAIETNDLFRWSECIGSVAFVWQMTRKPQFTNGLAAALNRLATWYQTNLTTDRNSRLRTPPLEDFVTWQYYETATRALAFGYDWAYDLLNPMQKSNVLRCLELRSAYIVEGMGEFFYDWLPNPFGGGDGRGLYSGGRCVRPDTMAKMGTAHGLHNYNYSQICHLAAFNDSPVCRKLFDLAMNYNLCVVYPFGRDGGVNAGRSYGMLHLFERSTAFNAWNIANISLPEVKLTNHPYWKQASQWWQLMTPLKYACTGDEFGDAESPKSLGGKFVLWNSPSFGRDLSLWLNDGELMLHWKNSVRLFGGTPRYQGIGAWERYDSVPLPYHYSSPAVRTNQDKAGLFLSSGNVVSMSHLPSDTNGFDTGVGFIFQARPSGWQYSHTFWNDLSFNIWAYGAGVCNGGNTYLSYYAQHPMSHFTLLVNGLGTAQPRYTQSDPLLSKIISYTNSALFTYCAADGTRAYPRSNFVAAPFPSSTFGNLHSGGPLWHLQMVQRHILFMRKKYFVVFDALASATNCTFSYLYHVTEPSLHLNPATMTFSYSATNLWGTGGSVTTYVAHIYQPNEIAVTNMSGTNAQTNPFTGERFSEFNSTYNPKAHALWFSNRTPRSSWNFMSVIYPVRPGSAAPTIVRISDDTVRVVSGNEDDVISFNGASTNATIVIDLDAIVPGALIGGRANPPTGLRVVPR